MKWYFYIGLIAAVCIAVYMMPQLIKTIKTKNTASISLTMFAIALVGNVFFVIDGIGIMADSSNAQHISAGLPIFLANLFALIISCTTAFYKIRNMVWAKKFQIKEEQIPEHFKEIKESLAKARAEKKHKKVQEKEAQQIDQIKKETPVSEESGSIVG